jgi:hypothetical protein
MTSTVLGSNTTRPSRKSKLETVPSAAVFTEPMWESMHR